MKYKATFFGRTKGAIGTNYRIETEVEGDSKYRANIKLYDRF